MPEDPKRERRGSSEFHELYFQSMLAKVERFWNETGLVVFTLQDDRTSLFSLGPLVFPLTSYSLQKRRREEEEVKRLAAEQELKEQREAHGKELQPKRRRRRGRRVEKEEEEEEESFYQRHRAAIFLLGGTVLVGVAVAMGYVQLQF